ncbi:hypothetical protein FisN_11Hh319 [Fistulifera solaris]|uniref:Uncharacterized protein n=1 Tax=Fistulifera solaris TaxID=1519565 RepID=A0A1Z5JFV3_FISSO|nr:hypothetical protein FisN_11Hh319 [Fistulifera solaris]|eukprot:GAX12883.1 hypothetical protein FisN_11Hh319 [Fistulifera solaris]
MFISIHDPLLSSTTQIYHRLPGSLQRQRRKRTIHACQGLTFLSFSMTFLSFDFFATVLGLTIVILYTCSTCWVKQTNELYRQQQPTSTALLTSSLLSFVCSGVMMWSVFVIALTTVCNETTDTSNNADTNTTLAPQEEEENTTDYDFFCQNRSWIWAFSILSSVTWFINACLLMWLSTTVPPPPPPPRRRQRPVMWEEDGDTVAETVVDENEEREDVSPETGMR